MENNRSEQFDKIKGEYSTFVDMDPIRNYLHYPAVMTQLDNVRGQHILDVGCGDGLFDTKLAREGAQVTGYDKAPNLIAIGQQRESQEYLGIEYKIADPTTFESTIQFDNAVSVMVLPYSPDEDYLKHFFVSTERALKTSGKFISVIFNPKFQAFNEIIANRRFQKIDDSGKVQVQFLNPKTDEVLFTAELSQFTKLDYEQAALKAGFVRTDWEPLFPVQEGVKRLGNNFWNKSKTSQPYATFIAQK